MVYGDVHLPHTPSWVFVDSIARPENKIENAESCATRFASLDARW
jgi:hypothetical protein